MTRILFAAAFLLGAAAVIWIGAGFIGNDLLALTVTLLIGLVYAIGCLEMLQYRRATGTLVNALGHVPSDLPRLDPWLLKLHPALQNAVRLRIEGERVALPGPVFTPYLVGLLVMLGLLGTFIGMVVTLNGAVLALEGTTELQAMRAGLATPIKGLGLAFGTSVAGVAASAMLGLISTISRRERMQASASLDQSIAAEFRGFSLQHNRQETYKAMQYQAQALPQVAERLQYMAQQIESMTRAMTDAVQQGQVQFQDTATQRFSELAAAVEMSLKTSLAESARLVGDSIQPLVEATVASVAQQSQQAQQNLQDQTQACLQTATDRFADTAVTVGQAWQSGLQAASDSLVAHWQENSKQLQAQQRQALEDLNARADRVTHAAEHSSTRLLQEWTQVLDRTSDLVDARLQTETQWLEQQNGRMEQLVETVRQELSALRAEESHRAAAAVERLADLESTVAGHLTQLGSALESPMLQLIETASQAPKAAAEVLEQLRREISNNIERDNELLQERQNLMAELNRVLSSLELTSSEQRAAIESLAGASTRQLAQISAQFEQQVATETGKLAEMADHLEASAVDVSSLSEAFGYAVELFSESNSKLIENLSRVEAALDKSSSRSDEQLAYYVAQAREIIDLSMMSQKEIIEELRHKSEAAPTGAEEVS